jgi:hypothetical protein
VPFPGLASVTAFSTTDRPNTRFSSAVDEAPATADVRAAANVWPASRLRAG